MWLKNWWYSVNFFHFIATAFFHDTANYYKVNHRKMNRKSLILWHSVGRMKVGKRRKWQLWYRKCNYVIENGYYVTENVIMSQKMVIMSQKMVLWFRIPHLICVYCETTFLQTWHKLPYFLFMKRDAKHIDYKPI